MVAGVRITGGVVCTSGGVAWRAMSIIPDITRHPDRWFKYFDTNNNGLLDTQSVINGFCLTFPSVDKNILTSIITEMWPSKIYINSIHSLISPLLDFLFSL
jgi:hypothetical protein